MQLNGSILDTMNENVDATIYEMKMRIDLKLRLKSFSKTFLPVSLLETNASQGADDDNDLILNQLYLEDKQQPQLYSLCES